jgi:hypothetical protein
MWDQHVRSERDNQEEKNEEMPGVQTQDARNSQLISSCWSLRFGHYACIILP